MLSVRVPLRDRLQALLVDHGWTSCFLAAWWVLHRIELATFELESFPGRTVSIASASDYDIAARTTLYMTSVALFAAAFLAGLFVLRGLALVTRRETISLLEPMSLCGLTLVVAEAFLLPLNTPLAFVLTLQAAWVGVALVDRWIFRRGEHPEPAAYFAALVLAILGAIFLELQLSPEGWRWRRDWTSGWLAGLVVALHVLVRAISWRRDSERAARNLASTVTGLPALACLPLLPILAYELFLELDHRGWDSLRLVHVQIALLLAVAAWVAARVWRAKRRGSSHSLEHALVRWAFPLLLSALTVRCLYRPLTMEPSELFENSNPALTIQQFYDFGRIPYVDTFGSHGLFESLIGFVWVGLHPEAWCAWSHIDFLREAVSVVLLYEVIRRASGNGYLALFVCALFPFRCELGWWYFETALISPLAVAWALARPSFVRWFALAALHAFLIAWRLDIGVAATAGALVTVVGMRWLDAGSKFRWRTALVASASLGVALAAVYVALALWRGVELAPRVKDVLHVMDSNQGFGYVNMAPAMNASILWQLGIVPVGLLATLGLLVLRAPLLAGSDRRLPFLAAFLMWGVVYYFANAQRGLVRHTWWENGSFLPAFSILCLALTPYLWPRLGARRAGTLFLAAGTVLGGSLAVRDAAKSSNLFLSPFERGLKTARVAQRLEDVPGSNARPVRDAEIDAKNYAKFRAFTASVLSPTQTFLDMTNSGMLYVDTHRRSPHFLNHLLLAHDEWLQQREIQNCEALDVSFVLVSTELDLSQADGVNPFTYLDKIPNDARHWRLREWVYANYEPWCVVQRWQVWRRRDFCPPVPPSGDDLQVRARAAPIDGEPLVLDASALEHTCERVAFLELEGTCARPSRASVRLVPADGSPAVVRELVLQPGRSTHCWTLPAKRAGTKFERLEVRLDTADFEFRGATLSDLHSPEYAEIFARAARPVVDRMFKLPWVWANRDERNAKGRPVLRAMPESAVSYKTVGQLELDPRDSARFRGGFYLHSAGVAVKLDPAARAPKAGEYLRLPGKEPMKIIRIAGERIFLDGDPIDPKANAGVANIEWLEPDASPTMSFPFEPLEDPSRPCYLRLRIAREENGAAGVVVRWGRDEVDFGGVDFELVGRGPQDYLVRPSAFYRWARGGADRLTIEWRNGRAALESVAILDGD